MHVVLRRHSDLLGPDEKSYVHTVVPKLSALLHLTGMLRAACSAAAALALLVVPRELCAEPEWNTAAQTSLCGLGAGKRVWKQSAFCGALRGDLLFGRQRNADFALGPYALLGTAKFSDVRVGAGVSGLVPTLGGDFPILLSGGLLSRNGSDLRLAGEAFFGLRSHNFHGAYAMASGLVLGADSSFSGGRANTVYLGLQIDGLWLVLPFILGYEWLHPPPERGD